MLSTLIYVQRHLQRDIAQLKYEVERKKEILKKVEEEIRNNCTHQWVRDSIDIDPDRSQTIFYCSKCELSK